MVNVRKMKNEIKKILIGEVIKKVLNNNLLKLQIKEMNDHFNMGKDYNPWPLGYDTALTESKLSDLEFNILLESLNYKLFYDRNSGMIIFKPGK